MRKTILFVVPHIYPCKTGGIEIFHYYFLKHIKKHYNVVLCTTCDKTGLDNDVTIYCHPSRMLGKQTVAKSYHEMKYIAKLRDQIDLIHLPYSSKSFFRQFPILMSRKLFGIPYVLRIHGGGMYPSRPFFLHQWLFDHAAGVMAVSTPIKVEYEKRHGRPITKIPSMLPFKYDPRPINELKKLYHLKTADVVLLFLGSIKEIKGPDILLDAFLRLDKKYIEDHRLRLIFAGDGPLRKPLQAKAQDSGLADFVRFLGQVPHERVSELYKLSTLFIIPSLMEARPLTLSEAFFNAKPSIGSDISTIGNIIKDGETGLLFKKGDPDDLSRKIRFMIDHPEIGITFGRKAGESYRSMYKYETMIADYCSFYDEAMNRAKRRR
jgi:glycosyltransferase involved in cell wall biosynthesis